MSWLLLMLLLLLPGQTACGQANPFRRPPPADSELAPSDTTRAPAPTPSPAGSTIWRRIPFMTRLLAVQRAMVERLSAYLQNTADNTTPAGVFTLLLLSFAYGVVHSLGPGHAKTLFVSYTMSSPVSNTAMWVAGAVFAATHAGTALALFSILRLALGMSQGAIAQRWSATLSISGALIMCAGAAVLAAPWLQRFTAAASRRFLRGVSSLKLLAVAAGLTPCPSVFLVLVFSHLVGALHIGILSIAAISLGMALTVSLLGHMGALIQGAVARRPEQAWRRVCQHTLRIVAGLVIVMIGAVMIAGRY